MAWDYAAAAPKPAWEVAEAHNGWIRNLAVSHDGKLLATASRDGLVRLWDAQTGKQVAEIADHKEDVYSVAFSPDDKTLASGDFMGTIKLWDVATRKHLRDLDGKNFSALERLQDCGGVRILLFTDGGKTLLAAGSEPVNGGTFQGIPAIATYDLTDAKSDGKSKKIWRLGETKDAFVNEVIVHADGYWIVTTNGVTGSGKLLLLKPSEDKPFAETTRVSNVHACSLHADGKRFILTSCNPNNSGNGAVKNKESKEYASNWSPVRFLELPAST
jgi:WD40 repeat protein